MRSRGPTEKLVQVELTDEQFDALNVQADETGESVSGIVKRAVSADLREKGLI